MLLKAFYTVKYFSNNVLWHSPNPKTGTPIAFAGKPHTMTTAVQSTSFVLKLVGDLSDGSTGCSSCQAVTWTMTMTDEDGDASTHAGAAAELPNERIHMTKHPTIVSLLWGWANYVDPGHICLSTHFDQSATASWTCTANSHWTAFHVIHIIIFTYLLF